MPGPGAGLLAAARRMRYETCDTRVSSGPRSGMLHAPRHLSSLLAQCDVDPGCDDQPGADPGPQIRKVVEDQKAQDRRADQFDIAERRDHRRGAKLERTAEGNRCVIALDFAASQFYDKLSHTYLWKKKHLSSKDMIEVYEELISTYPIYSIEDGLGEDDWSGWHAMKEALQSKIATCCR